MKKQDKPGSGTYLHGFSVEERERLFLQARFLENSIFKNVDFSHSKTILELGCGVGAQTEIILRRFPNVRVTGVDASEDQILHAKTYLKASIDAGRAHFDTGFADKLTYADASFDGAFLCWFLEHVAEPMTVMRELRRVLKPNGVIFCNEPMNSTFFVEPYSAATMQYLFAYNDHQWNLKGDPFVGAKLGNYLLNAGFEEIVTQHIIHHYDNRNPVERAEFLQYWTELLLSGAPALIQVGKARFRYLRLLGTSACAQAKGIE
jgi:ubiquinone/menaquinone biosynthesis C-methylase UbiE